MPADESTIELARRLRELGDQHPTLYPSIAYRLAAAHLLDLPGDEIRGLNRAYVRSLDERFLLEILIDQLSAFEPFHPPATETVLSLLREAQRILNEKV